MCNNIANSLKRSILLDSSEHRFRSTRFYKLGLRIGESSHFHSILYAFFLILSLYRCNGRNIFGNPFRPKFSTDFSVPRINARCLETMPRTFARVNSKFLVPLVTNVFPTRVSRGCVKFLWNVLSLVLIVPARRSNHET